MRLDCGTRDESERVGKLIVCGTRSSKANVCDSNKPNSNCQDCISLKSSWEHVGAMCKHWNYRLANKPNSNYQDCIALKSSWEHVGAMLGTCWNRFGIILGLGRVGIILVSCCLFFCWGGRGSPHTYPRKVRQTRLKSLQQDMKTTGCATAQQLQM